MRVVMISKALVIGAYHSKLKQLAAQPDMELTAIVPPSWRDERGELKLERTTGAGYNLIVTPLRFNGNFHLHYYPQLDRSAEAAQARSGAHRRRAVQPGDVSGQRSAQPSGRAHRVLQLAKPEAHVSAALLLVRALHSAARRGRHRGQSDAEHVWRAKGYRGPLTVIPQVGVEPDVFKPLETAERRQD